MAKYKLYYLLILLILFSGCHQNQSIKNKQNQNNDSIEAYLKLAQNDTLGFEKRNEYNDKAFSFIDLKTLKNRNFKYIYLTTVNYYNFNNPYLLKKGAKILYINSKKKKNKYYQALSLKLFGLYHMFKSENVVALDYFFKAKKIFNSLKKQRDVIKVLETISLTQYYAGDFLGSNKTAFEILKLNRYYQIKEIDDNCYMQIGNNLSNLKLEYQAIKYYKKIDVKNNDYRLKNIVINNISSSYIVLNQYNKGLNCLNEVLSNSKFKKNNPNIYITSLSLYAYCKLKMKKYNGLQENFINAEKLFKKNNCISGRNYNQIYLSEFYHETNENEKAIHAAKKALALSKQYKNPNDVLISLKQLIQVDPTNAAHYAQDYIQLNDILQQVERRFRDKFAQIAFETENIKKEKEEAELKIGYIIGVSLIITSFLLILYVLNYKRVKDKELELILLEQNTNESKYHMILEQKKQENEIRQNVKNKIALELHDGVMNNLVSTRLNLMVLQHKQDSETVKECIEYIKNIQIIENNIRNLAHNLHHNRIEENKSLLELLQNHINDQNKLTNTQYTFEWDTKINSDKLPENYTQQIYRIVQEATQNINKHAQAKKATIVLLLDNGNLCLSIMDNGVGFDTSQIGKGIGLNNLEQRVANLNGKLIINSFPNENTFINISIPI